MDNDKDDFEEFVKRAKKEAFDTIKGYVAMLIGVFVSLIALILMIY